MSDVPNPGEVDLEVPAPAAAAVADSPAAETPPPEPVAEAAAEEAPAVEAAPPAPKKPSMLEELIAERTLRKQAEGRLRQAEPLLQRLTPEIRQAIHEGRLTIQPPQSNADLEKDRLTQVANDLGLFKADNTPDLDAARRVDKYVRGTVQAAVEPVRNMTLAEKAQHNVGIALNHAKTNGLPVDIVQETYMEILRQPNGAQLLSQPEVATTVWHQAIGRAFAQGKLAPAKAQAAAAAGPPAVVVAEGTGRRAPGAAITLSPALQQVYRDNGMDPAKATAAAMPKVDARGHMELE